MDGHDEYLDTDGAAQFFGVSEETVRGWRRRGVGPAFYRVGGKITYRREDLEGYLNGCRVEPAQAATATS